MKLWKKLSSALPWHSEAKEGGRELERRPPRQISSSEIGTDSASFLPTPARLEEDEEAFTLTVEAPGYDTKDLDVSVSPDRIVIEGKRVEDAGDRGGRRWSHREGFLHIEVPIGAAVVQAKAIAGLKNGVLTIRVPKTEESRRRVRRVPVTG